MADSRSSPALDRLVDASTLLVQPLSWTAEKYETLAKWIDAHPEKLKMPGSEFGALLAKARPAKEK
jgi:hypothetical protein